MADATPTPSKARFRVGDAVTVLNLPVSGHMRTPDYIREQTGEVVQLCGFFLNPERLAVGDTRGPVVALYRVAFSLQQLWPEYARRRDDELYIEVYDHWLEPVAG